MSLVMGFELRQGNETLHHPNKLYIHLHDNSVWDRKTCPLCFSCLQEVPMGRLPVFSSYIQIQGTLMYKSWSLYLDLEIPQTVLPLFVYPSPHEIGKIVVFTMAHLGLSSLLEGS